MKAGVTTSKRAKPRKRRNDPRNRVGPIKADEAHGAKTVTIGILHRYAGGLYYGGHSSIEEAVLEKVQRPGSFGDKERQLLVFKEAIASLLQQGAISDDRKQYKISVIS